MIRRFVLTLAAVVMAVTVAAVPSAQAAKPVGGSLTTTVTVPPTTVAVNGFNVTLSGELTATVTQFKFDSNGHVVAIATVSGTLTATEPTLGTATVTINNVRVVLNAQVQADCSGHLHIDFQGVLQIDATVVFTSTDGTTTTLDIHKTVPLHGSLDFTATTEQQQSLICDIATLLQHPSSTHALVDKLNTLLKQI